MKVLTLRAAKWWLKQLDRIHRKLSRLIRAIEPSPPRNPEQLALMAKSLHEIREWLDEDLEATKDLRSNKHKRLAIYLRLLLCGDHPVLIEYARAQNTNLWTFMKSEDLRKLRGRPMTSFGSGWSCIRYELPASRGWTKIRIDQLMSRAFGVIPDGKGRADTFTVSELITRVASWDGIAHLSFDLEKRRKLKWMGGATAVAEDGARGEHIDVKMALFDIGSWAVCAIDEVLNRRP